MTRGTATRDDMGFLQIECPVCGDTVRARNKNEPRMHLFRRGDLPARANRWCEGGNPLYNGALFTPEANQ